MKRIVVTGAGGSPSTNFIRSLRASNGKFFIVGTDCNKYYLQRAEVDRKYLIPKCDDESYIPILNEIIKKNQCEFLHAQNDSELGVISNRREEIHAKTFLPAKKTVNICLDKLMSHKIWKKSGIPQPQTILIKNKGDLVTAFEKIEGEIWLRNVVGAGGKGSIMTNKFEIAKNWIDFKNGWGNFTASEYLSPNSVTWMSIWKNGELVVAQTRKRLYWELSKISPSGVTGATGGAITINNKNVDDMSLDCIHAIDKNPNGIFSVDMTYNEKHQPIPTEINIGRFFTTHGFFTKAGLNMPHIFIKLAYEEKIPEFTRKINPLKEGLIWIRGMDFLPILVDEKTIEKYVEDLEKMKKDISHEG